MSNEKYGASAIDGIKRKVRLINGIVLLVVVVLLFVVMWFLYEFLDYVPAASVVSMLATVAVLTASSVFLTGAISRRAIRAIDGYGNKLTRVLKTTKHIHEIRYADVLLENIMDTSLGLTGADGGSVLLLENESLVFRAVRGSGSTSLKGMSMPKSYGIAGWVVQNGSPVRVDDVQDDRRFYGGVDRQTGYETRSILCVPLRLESGIIGAMELVNKNNGGFDPEDEGLLTYFAEQAAIAIERSKACEDAKNFEIHLTSILDSVTDRLVPYKRGHSKRVAKYALIMAEATKMPEDMRKRLYRASLLHDIGFLKIWLDDNGVLPGQPDYKAHALAGYELLSPINIYSDIARAVLHHHERYDGTGYPAGLMGEDIPVESRMIAVAEAFDVISNRDSYKYSDPSLDGHGPAAGFREALIEIGKNAGTQFDPKLVDAFTHGISEDDVEY